MFKVATDQYLTLNRVLLPILAVSFMVITGWGQAVTKGYIKLGTTDGLYTQVIASFFRPVLKSVVCAPIVQALYGLFYTPLSDTLMSVNEALLHIIHKTYKYDNKINLLITNWNL